MIVWGYEQRSKPLRLVQSIDCRACNTEREFRYTVRYQHNHLWYLFGFASGKRYLRSCTVCGHGETVDPAQVETLLGGSGIPIRDRFGLLALVAGGAALVGIGALYNAFSEPPRNIPELSARVARGDESALRRLRREARAGDVPSQVALANLLAGHGNQNFLDDQEAFGWALQAARHANVQAQAAVASRYEQGIGTPVDLSQALAWYTKAAEGGEGEAANNLGAFYLQGLATPADREQALHWFRESAEHGHPSGAYNLAMTLLQSEPPEVEEGLRWLRAAAESEREDETSLGAIARAQNELGRRHEQGDGVARDMLLALEYYRRASPHSEAAAASIERLRALLQARGDGAAGQ